MSSGNRLFSIMDMVFLCLAALSVESHLDPFVDDISGSTVASKTIGRLVRGAESQSLRGSRAYRLTRQ
ncbi:Cytochrome P450 monooxygenase FCK2 [Fusarium oxysporum f. sp. albedinis]|nr:Cytochrome P450 monooxygenase FCK2 [Fusarium oxysporum f. sp. albedinis]